MKFPLALSGACLSFLFACSVAPLPTSTISGVVLGSDGQACGSVAVQFISEGGISTVLTEADGSFSFSAGGQEGAVLVVPSKEGYGFTPGSISLDMGGKRDSYCAFIATATATGGILIDDYFKSYPARHDVYMDDISTLSSDGTVGIRLSLSNSYGGTKYEYYDSVDTDPVTTYGQVDVAFDSSLTEICEKTMYFRRIDGNGTKDLHHMDVGYFPKAHYAESGQTAPGYVIIRATDIVLQYRTVEDYILDVPSAGDIEYAESTWGPSLSGLEGYQKARALAKCLVGELSPHMGTPSDGQNAADPFTQYRNAMNGDDYVWCYNISLIFTHACNCLGIPARRIGAGNGIDTSSEPWYLLAEGHSTSEIFDEASNSWIMMDLVLLLTGVGYELSDGTVARMNVLDFQRALYGACASSLEVEEYDQDQSDLVVRNLADSAFSGSILGLYKETQQFYFYAK